MSAKVSALDRVLKEIDKSPFSQQLIAGTLTGFTTGFITSRTRRIVAGVVGTGIILFHVAQEARLTKKNWNDVQKQASAANTKLGAPLSKFKQVATKNKTFAVGLVGGFLLGLST